MKLSAISLAITTMRAQGGGSAPAYNPLVVFGADLVTWYGNSVDELWNTQSGGGTVTLYQDSAGTTPVTAVEQFIGLVLDKSLGLDLGANLFGGTFTSVASPWVANGDGSWSINGSQTGDVDLQASGSVGAIDNKWCEWRITVSGLSSGVLAFYPGSNTPVALGNGVHRFLRPRSSLLFVVRAPAGRAATVSGISVRELPGHHLSQSTATARPRLTRRVNLMVSTNDFSASAWAKQGVTVLSAVEGGADKIIATTASETYKGVSTSGSAVGTPADSRATVRFLAKPSGYSVAAFVAYGNGGRAAFDLVNNTATTYGGQNMVASVVDGGDGFKVCKVTFDTLIGGEVRVGPRPTVSDGSVAFSGDGSSGILLKEFDLRLAAWPSSWPQYQRVTSATDYDEVGFPARLATDGTDDFLSSGQLPLGGLSVLSTIGAFRRASSGRTDGLWVSSPAASGFALLVSAPDSDRLRVDLLDSTKKTIAPISAGALFVAAASFDATQANPSDEVVGRVNGVAGTVATQGAGVASTMSNAAMEVGRWAGGNYLSGDIFALPMIVKRLMTPAELAAAEKAFGKSIGVPQ